MTYTEKYLLNKGYIKGKMCNNPVGIEPSNEGYVPEYDHEEDFYYYVKEGEDLWFTSLNGNVLVRSRKGRYEEKDKSVTFPEDSMYITLYV